MSRGTAPNSRRSPHKWAAGSRRRSASIRKRQVFDGAAVVSVVSRTAPAVAVAMAAAVAAAAAGVAVPRLFWSVVRIGPRR